jgi:hypothetical protein
MHICHLVIGGFTTSAPRRSLVPITLMSNQCKSAEGWNRVLVSRTNVRDLTPQVARNCVTAALRDLLGADRETVDVEEADPIIEYLFTQ